MPVHLTCSTCGNDFLRNPSKARLYCSNECRRNRPPSPTVVDGDVAYIPLHALDGSVRAYATVDVADAEWASQRRWSYGARGYARRYEKVGGVEYMLLMHRELLGLSRDDRSVKGDHIDRNRLNNRRDNLRAVTHAGNSQNHSSHRGATSTHRGVSLDSATGTWRASIRTNGKTINLGNYADELEAAEVARVARARLLPYAVD